MNLLKRHVLSLEKVFHAEIENRLPFQSKGKTFVELANHGYLEIGKRVIGAGRFPAIVSGYCLTHKGRMAYCDWASKHMKRG